MFVAVSNGKIQHRNSAGALLETLDTQLPGFTTGMVFDVLGNLYVTNFSAANVSVFSNTGVLTGRFGSGYTSSPESILFDRSGNAYVGAADGDHRVRKFDSAGHAIAQYAVAIEERGSDWIDLAADQCTLYYTSEGRYVKRFNLCTGSQATNFNSVSLPGPDAYALRLLPDGGLLVADTTLIVKLDSQGNQVRTYGSSGQNCWFALNLDPDGQSFWSADFCTSTVHKFNISTGAETVSFSTGTPSSTVFGLVVYGEIVA